jgi:hypothetical protein
LKFAFTPNWCHQSILFDTEKTKSLKGYDTHYKYASDYDLILRLASSFGNKRIPAILAKFYAGGAADNNLIAVHQEKVQIRKALLQGRLIHVFSNIWFYIMITKLEINKLRRTN